MGDNRIYDGRFENVVQAHHIDHVHFHVPPPRTRTPVSKLRHAVAAALAAAGAALLLLDRYRLPVPADALPGPARATVVFAGASCLVLAVFAELSALWEPRSRRRPEPEPSRADLDRAAEELAETLKTRYDRDERLSRIHDPFPIPVRWTAADPLLTDHWRNIRRAGSVPPEDTGADRPLEVDGHFDEIAGLFTSLPAQRLVVLGRPGAGKSVLALHLAHRLVEARGPASGDPVPVVFPLASWDPKRSGLWTWAARRIVEGHPGALAGGGGRAHALALALIASGRVLPVLDGFDELPRPSQADALRELRASLAGPARFLLTSRTEEYTAAVEAENTVLPATAVVELQPLTAGEVAAYLPRTARRTSRDDGSRTVWEPVLRRLEDPADQSREVRVLRAVLGTPLMIGLARVVYSDGGAGADPAELLSAGRFTTRAAVEQHLFDAFLSAAYGGALDDRAGRPPWSADDARRWTGFLARYLRASGTQDLEWWRLDEAVPRAVRALVALPAFLLLLLGVQVSGFGTPWWHKWVGLPYGAALVLGIVAVLVSDWAEPDPLPGPYQLHGPSGARLRAALRSRQQWMRAAFCVGALALGVVASAQFSPGLIRSLTSMTTAGLAAYWTADLARALCRPADPEEATEPSVLLTADRKATVTVALFDLFGPARYVEHHAQLFNYTVVYAAWWQWAKTPDTLGPAVWARAGACFAAASLCHGIAVSAWGRYTVARCWLALTGRLPWRLMAFLRDAHARGILRQAGGVYRFRHIELRNRLADTSGLPSAHERPTRLPASVITVAASVMGAAILLQPSAVLFMAPPPPYTAVPPACTLLDDHLLAKVMADPMKVGHGRAACGAGEQSPFHPDVSVSLRTFVTSTKAEPDLIYMPASTMVRTTPYASDTLKGLGDEARQGTQDGFFSQRMEGDQHTAVLGTRVANVVLRLSYTEEFASASRAQEVARILMRAALRHAHLSPKHRQSAERPLADVPRTRIPANTRFAYYHRREPKTLTGAHWGENERSHLWSLDDFAYVFRAPKYMSCKTSADVTVTCTSDGPDGLRLPRLRLRLASRHCVRACAEATRFWLSRPGFSSTPWKRVTSSLWYAETTPDARTYRMLLARTVTYPKSKDIYLVWAEAETDASHRAPAQKIINDLYTGTGG
ncbi:NACHT domain-containing protein [Streptomyces sp. Go40/10]|uniref:NACHT domain-containing protein n=1 Tax=Streptomyces sp. Go40/10 TaxID=2825844 RepID=UPI001E340CF7|nr:NACHT domain-containing protein [Streptomyces sp. Go40/10]UFR05067.1 NACHT domain-containing protein [Streptomyces sp. Go40/10]